MAGVWSCREEVKWPSDMHPVFKNFLEGLLQKHRKKRLSWPHLLYHPFVCDGMEGWEGGGGVEQDPHNKRTFEVPYGVCVYLLLFQH